MFESTLSLVSSAVAGTFFVSHILTPSPQVLVPSGEQHCHCSCECAASQPLLPWICSGFVVIVSVCWNYGGLFRWLLGCLRSRKPVLSSALRDREEVAREIVDQENEPEQGRPVSWVVRSRHSRR